MVDKILKSFDVRYLQVLDESGIADDSVFPALTDEEIKKTFEYLMLTRVFNDRALSLQREGRLGTYASVYGQEASQVGSAMVLNKDDWMFPSFREMGAFIVMGYPIWMILRYWTGDERGAKCPDDLNIFPMCVPVGSHLPHAVGAAWGMKLKKDKKVSLCYFGDGATSRGDFHESMNFAGVYKLPVIFLCQNNQWAISLSRKRQTASETIAQKAIAYGVEGLQVDGNDVFAVYSAMKKAVERARAGQGATLIECLTYRLGNHTTADDASRYRDEEEVCEWEKKEPLIRVRLYMEKQGLWTEDYEKDVRARYEKLVDEEIEKEEAYPPSEPGHIVTHTYSHLTPRQIKELKELGWQEK